MTVTVVLGASSGIGKAFVEYQKSSDVLVLVSRRQDVLEDVARSVPTETSVISGDVTDVAFVDELFTQVEEEYDGYDNVVHCIGKGGEKRIDTYSYREWKSLFSVNVDTVFSTFQRSRDVLEKRHGSYVCISSMAGLFTFSPWVPYCASKHAVTSFLRGAKAETSVNIGILHPGKIQTPFFDEDQPRWQAIPPRLLVPVMESHIEGLWLKRWLARFSVFGERVKRIVLSVI